jgi:hypothetical protein
LPISPSDTIALAFEHMKRQLFQPFRFWQWTRLAFVGLLAGELGSGGGFNAPSGFNPGQHPGSPDGLSFPHLDFALLAGIITVLVIVAFVFGIILLYISSVMRFILFDSVVAKNCRIREGWRRRQSAGWKYFLWQAGFALAILAGMVVLLGIPALFAFLMGWFRDPHQHLVGFILGGIFLCFLILAFLIAAAVSQVLTKDFVVPQMALEGIGAIEGWRRLWPMIESEMGGYATYVGLKIVLAIGAGIAIFLVSLIAIFILLIPIVGVGVAVGLGGKAAGLTWNVFTITAIVVAVLVVVAILFYLLALISVPVIVFFPAYAVYFFAARYRPLSLILYPPPPPLPSEADPPPETPPLAPAPA